MGAPKLDPKAFKKVAPKTSEDKLTALKARVEMYAKKLEEMMKDEETAKKAASIIENMIKNTKK